LKQTQTDPWQQVLESYNEGDVVSGKVTKVVTFGAFVEILPGVEGLVHISELAQHHVENPREVVSQGDTVNVRILEVDAERRRLSLSLKRVDDGMPLQPGAGEDAAPPTIDLSEDVFSDESAAAPAAEAEPVESEPELVEPEAVADEPPAVAESSDEPVPAE
jgi:small subunit ribosomal protein S1